MFVLAASREICGRTGELCQANGGVPVFWRHAGYPALLEESSGLGHQAASCC